MIIYCPECGTETLLTKTPSCPSHWKCDKCNKCCLTKNGTPFQNLKDRDDPIIENERQEKEKPIVSHIDSTIKTQTKKRSRQLSIFDSI